MRDLVREVLDEFFAVCLGFREARGELFDLEVSHNLDPESRRREWREKNRKRGLCRSCTRPAEAGRKSCYVHLERNNQRARRSQAKKEAA